MKINRELERRAFMFYKRIDNYINKHIGSEEDVQIELLSIIMFVIREGKV